MPRQGGSDAGVEGVEDDDDVTGLGRGDHVTVGGDLEAAAPRHLQLGAGVVREELEYKKSSSRNLLIN